MIDNRSGRVDLVMVACVAREVTMIVDPALFYKVSRIHILNYVSENGESEAVKKRAQLYRDVRDTVHQKLEDSGIEVVMHDRTATYLFEGMMKEVYSILKEEESRGSTVYVNISGGTYEYSAAAAIAAMMVPGTILFNVGARNSIEGVDALRDMLTKDGELVGTTDDVHDPFRIRGFKINSPDIERLKALQVFDDIPLNKRTNTTVIRRLIIEGIWIGSSGVTVDERKRGTSMEFLDEKGKPVAGHVEEYHKRRNSENVRYQKYFIDRWKENGWIRPAEGSRSHKYELTDEGLSQLNMFCSE